LLGLLNVHQALLAREVHHEIVHLSRSVSEADDIPAALGLEPTRCGVVRVYTSDDGPVAALLPAGEWPDERQLVRGLRLAGHSAAGLRPASRDETAAATDYQAGLVSPLGLAGDVTTLADAKLAAMPVVYVPTGDSGTALGIHTEDLLILTGARVTWLTLPAERDRESAERVLVLSHPAATAGR
jgi:prolyl-tRNA editing enzyme YbaK/EbsC (Cys-tRNA(Pro) deacylase)